MKKYIFILFLSCSISTLANAKGTTSGTPYRCPLVNEITYEQNGTPIATTTINGVTVPWYGIYELTTYKYPASNFYRVNMNQGATPTTYQIYCVYNTDPKDPSQGYIFMDVRYDAYEADGLIGDNWVNNSCIQSDPNNCQFTTTKN
jgi:hypothetical protein